jgi:hypothetical protein
MQASLRFFVSELTQSRRPPCEAGGLRYTTCRRLFDYEYEDDDEDDFQERFS